MAKRSRRRKLPEPFAVDITALSHEGRGIAQHNGKTIFVFDALPDEKVLIQVTKTHKSYDEAKTLEVLKASDKRIEPQCEYFGLCGGCSMQHVSAKDQIDIKQKAVLDMMQHAGIKDCEVLPPLVGEAWHYRQKARIGVKYVRKKQKLLVGFREKNSAYLTDMDSCQVLEKSVGLNLKSLKTFIESLEGRESIPQIELACDDEHIAMVFRHLQPLSEQDLLALGNFAKDNHYWLQLQPQGIESIHNLYPQEQKLWLKPESELAIEFSPSDFTQVNTSMNRKMIQQALRYMGLEKQDKVLDLFCGLGNFSLPMARRCRQVTGVEGSAVMTQHAKLAAKSNQLENAIFYDADLTQPNAQDDWMMQKYDKILLDPPRTGAYELIKIIGRFKAKRIVYISCQPSTLTRDAAELCSQGYKMTYLGVMDMFPQTAHVESMAVFDQT